MTAKTIINKAGIAHLPQHKTNIPKRIFSPGQAFYEWNNKEHALRLSTERYMSNDSLAIMVEYYDKDLNIWAKYAALSSNITLFNFHTQANQFWLKGYSENRELARYFYSLMLSTSDAPFYEVKDSNGDVIEYEQGFIFFPLMALTDTVTQKLKMEWNTQPNEFLHPIG